MTFFRKHPGPKRWTRRQKRCFLASNGYTIDIDKSSNATFLLLYPTRKVKLNKTLLHCKNVFFSRKKLDGPIVVYTFFVRMRRIYLSLSPSLCSTAAGSKSFLNEYKYVMVCYIRVLRKYIFQVLLLNKGLLNLALMDQMDLEETFEAKNYPVYTLQKCT